MRFIFQENLNVISLLKFHHTHFIEDAQGEVNHEFMLK